MSLNKCPNCGKKLTKNFCMYCGYMTTGMFIEKNKPKSISDVEIYLGERHDKINRNNNSLVVFLLGPLYFCYNKFLLFGLLACIFDFLFCKLFFFIFDKTAFTLLFSVIALRFIYVTVANMLCLWLFDLKVKFIKKRYKDKYLDYLRKNDKNTASVLYIILALAIVGTVFILVTEVVRNINIK